MITSVEYVNFYMSGTTTSGSLSKGQTIANCVPFSTISGSVATGGNLNNFFADIWFTDTGTPTVHAQRDGSDGPIEIGIFVVEFDSAEVTVQQGSYSTGSNDLNGTISTVDLDKTAMVNHYRSSTTNEYAYDHFVACSFNNTTQVNIHRNSTGGNINGHYYVFEDTGGDNFRVQTVDSSFAYTGAYDYEYTVRDRTFILMSYYSNDGSVGYPDRYTPRAYIYDDHRVSLDKDSSSNTVYFTMFIIEFLDDTKAYTQHWWETGLNDYSTVTYTKKTDYPIDLDTSMVLASPIQGGITRQSGVNNVAYVPGAWWHSKFTSTSGIQLDREISSGLSYTFWQVIDWEGYTTFTDTGTNPSPITDELIVSIEEVEIELGNAGPGNLISSRYGWQQLTKGQDTDNCVIFSSYRISGSSGLYYELGATVGIDGTRIFAHRPNTSNGALTVHAFVVEFNPAEVNVVHGYHYFNTQSSNVTISTLTDYTKAFMLSNYWGGASGQYSYYFYTRNRLTSNTNITFDRGAAGGSINTYYFVVEDIGDNWTVQARELSTSATSISDSGIAHVPWHNTFSITSHYSGDSTTYPQRASIRHYHYHYNMFILQKESASGSISTNTFLVTFTDTYRQRVHRDYLTLSNVSDTNDADLWYAIDLDSSIVQSTVQQMNVRSDGTTQAQCEGIIATFKFLNDSQIRVERTNTSLNGTLMWEAIDWIGKTLVDTGTNPDPWVDEFIVSIEYLEDIEVDDRITWFELTKGQNIDNCVPFVSCRLDPGMAGTRYKILPEVWFEDPSLLYIWRSTDSGKMYYDIQVIEFNPAKVKVQQGKFNFTAASATAAIEEVDLDRTFAITYYNANDTVSLNYTCLCETYFNSATQLKLERGASVGWINAHFYVVEALNNEWAVQTIKNSTSTASIDDEISPIDKSRAFIIVSSRSSDSTSYPQRASTVTSLQTKIRTRTTRAAASNSIYWTAFIIEFTDHTKKYVQCNYVDLSSSVYTYNYDLPSIQTDQGWATTSGASTIHNTKFPGFFRNDGTATNDWEGAFGTMRLTSTSGIEIKREIGACGTTSHAAWEVVDWVGIPYDTYTPLPVSDSMIVSIEKFDFTMVNTWRKYLTLTKGQDINNCVPFITLKGSGTSGYHYRLMPTVDFIEDNRVLVRRFSGTGTLDISLQVVEFNPAKIRIQRGDDFTTASTLNKTVSEVDISKTFIVTYTACESSSLTNYTHLWRAYFTTNTNILFQRGASVGYSNIYYYVIEALDDAFSVEWLTMEATGTSYTEYTSSDIVANVVLNASYYSSDSTGYPSRGLVDFYTNTENNQVTWTRSDGSNSIYARVQVITFNENYARAHRKRYSLGAGDASTSITMSNPMNELSTIILPIENYGITRVNSSTSAHYECGFHKQTLAAGGGQIDINRTSAVASYSMAQAIEFLGASAYIFGGTITENEAPVDRVVRGYRADTGEFIGETTSSGGAWELSTTHSGAHYVICLDDYSGFDYNDLIYGGLLPATISG